MAQWDKIRSRGGVDDRRGMTSFGLGSLGGAGIFGVLALLAVNALLGGGQVDLNSVLSTLESAQVTQSGEQPVEFQGADDYETFTSTVLGSTNDAWTQVFSGGGKQYKAPQLVLFRGATQSGCGVANSQVGPHYCSADETIYLDETFFDELTKQFGAQGGDVAEAYVIAHEVGHHVQNRLGIMDKYGASRDNEDSIRLELQADCFAGIWAHSIRDFGVFEQGEINEAIDAAEAVGDDRIQESVQGRVNPESWTHGSSEQRKKWFTTGYNSGDPSHCDTFQ